MGDRWAGGKGSRCTGRAVLVQLKSVGTGMAYQFGQWLAVWFWRDAWEVGGRW